MTSEGLAKPRRLRTLFLHFSWSICRTVWAFFSSRLAARISAPIYDETIHGNDGGEPAEYPHPASHLR